MWEAQNLRIYSSQVANGHLTSIAGHVSGRYIASGCMDGSVYVMSIGTTLTDPLPSEKSTVLQVTFFKTTLSIPSCSMTE